MILNNVDPNRLLTDITVTVSGNVTGFDLYGMVTGDFNSSFTPSAAKSTNSSLALTYDGSIQVGANQVFELPLRAASAMEIGAVSMILNIPSDLVEVMDVKVNGSTDPVSWTMNGNELRIGWNSATPVNIPENGTLVNLKLKTTNAFTVGQSIVLALTSDQLNELADGNFNVIEGAVLLVEQVDNGMVGINNQPDSHLLSLSNYPNPFSTSTTVTYALPYNGKVTLEVYNMLGQLISTLVDETQNEGKYSVKIDGSKLQQGFYSVKLRLQTKEAEIDRSIKLIVN